MTLKDLFLNWTIVYIGNWAGTLLVAYFLGYLTKLFDSEQYRSYLEEVVHHKLEELSKSPLVGAQVQLRAWKTDYWSDWGQLFLRAIPANTMVCMAVVLGLACRGSAGKILAMWFPVVMFVLCGFEHCVANSESALLVPRLLAKFTSVLLFLGPHAWSEFYHRSPVVQPVCSNTW